MAENRTSASTKLSSAQSTTGSNHPSPSRPRTQQGEVPQQAHQRRAHWIWPVGIALAGLGSAAAFMLRGCWHTQMGWPVRVDDEFSYQVCTSCGIKRLYDEATFHAYGPYGYDLHELIAMERAARLRRRRRHTEQLKDRAGERAEASPET